MRYTFLILSLCYSLLSVAASPHPEQRLLAAVDDIQAANMASAEARLQQLLQDVPDFKLAQLVYADVLAANAGVLQQPAAGIENSEQKALLLKEVRNRYRSVNEAQIKKQIPAVLARLDNSYRHAIVIDLSKSRLYLFDNSGPTPRLINDFFVSMGRGGAGKFNEGDLKTPLGVYFVQSYIPSENLADKYGAGAYPINYPNAWDRLNGKTGHGIWLHGTRSGTYNRPPLASEGCVVLPNDDLLNVGAYIDLKNTPVLIGQNIQWLAAEDWQQHQQQINQIQAQWKADWESLDVEKYLSHYSRRFSNGHRDFSSWVDYKRRIARHKTFVDVELSNVSLLLHPDEDVMVATFLQNYRSDNFSSQSWKRQYWHKESDGQWRIVFEDKISPPLSTRLARVP